MNFNAIKNIGYRAYMKLRKISPELALAAGITCGVGAVIAGCIATRKVDAKLADVREELDEIQGAMEVADSKEESHQLKKDAFHAYTKMAWELTKLYAPTVTLTLASTGFILASHGILSKRYVGVSTAYNALDGAFKDYRSRVAKVIGEDAEKVLLGGGTVEKNIKVSDEDNNVTTKSGSSIVINNHKNSPYEFDFNRFTAKGVWEPNAEYNEMRLRNTQTYFNELFQARGHVFLNEVLDALGMERTPAGAVCGWMKGAGDDYIDFGYWDSYKRDFNIDSDLCVKNIHLNFNCDGSIWDMI